MLKIGLTGGPGTGKTTALGFFSLLGFKTVSSDEIVRKIQQSKGGFLKKISSIFGNEFISKNGNLKRKKLRTLIFENKAKRKRLEKLIHPLVNRERKRIIKDLVKRGCRSAVFEVPLLFEAKLDKEFDLTVLVTSSKRTQKRRLQKRDVITSAQADLMIDSQMPLQKKKTLCDLIITNNHCKKELFRKIKKLKKKIYKLYKV